jgi:tetratricopeptide (TPR) repeat protein
MTSLAEEQRGRRQRLLALIRERLERFSVDHNPVAVLESEALAEVTALLETVPDPTADLEIAHAAGWMHWSRYLVQDPGDDQQDLASALALFMSVYRIRPGAVPDGIRVHLDRSVAFDHPQGAADRAVTLLRETLRSGDQTALDIAIDLLRQAVVADPTDHPARAGWLSNLGAALRTRFERSGDLADLDAAVDVGQQAVVATPANHSARASVLSNLALALRTRFERTGDQAALDVAIDLLWQAVAVGAADHPARAGWLSNLGAALRTRFERSGDLADLDAAVDVGQQAVAVTPASHPARASVLSNLGVALWTRFERSGDLGDLDAAVDVGQQGVAVTPASHPARASVLSNLGVALRARFERTGSRGDLDAAIDLFRQSVAASPTDHPARAGWLSNLGVALRARFERTGDRADLDGAIDLLHQAVVAGPTDHSTRASWLSNLGVALRIRFERSGNLADLDAAIDAGQRAVTAGPADHSHRAGWLSNLGGSLTTRFVRSGNLVDLDAAIDVGLQAVAATSRDHPDRAIYLSNLAAALRARFERTGEVADLDDAIDAGLQAVAASPANHPDHAGRLSNLGVALRDRFGRTRDRADLDGAIDLLRQAAAVSLADHPDHASSLSNLGTALRIRFERIGDVADLDDAIDAARLAVAVSLADHPARAGRLSSLATALRIRLERIGEVADLDAAIDVGRQAVAVEAASPRIRVMAACEWGRAAAGGQRWQEAVAGFTAAAEFIGLVAPRSLTRSDQEHLLEDLGGLAADAAVCCVHAGLTQRAVELFEQCRGVLLGQALDTRTDLTALTEQYPDLAARFTGLRDDLDRTDDHAGTLLALPAGEAGRDGVERRRAAATAFDQVILEIRQIPNFRNFLRPPSAAELLVAAVEGPVVVVAVSRFGSYALILSGSDVLDPVPLTRLTSETVNDQVTAFLSALEDSGPPGAGDRAAAEQQPQDILSWLWEAIAAPVLERLGISGPPRDNQPWPRLWWCVSGPLSLLPLHAAGRHHTLADTAPATVIDRVISSYAPTIRALIHARRPRPGTASHRADRPSAGDRVVVVAMPHTPGAVNLPGAQAEAVSIQRRLPGRVTVLTGPHATYDTVLKALPAGRWAHFACHGTSDLTNPSASCLLLTDHEQRPLTVVDVARLRLDDAGLAFLSVCSAARLGERLADEAIHLASAFQLAGYRHVIATLWPIRDRHAVKLTSDIYTTLSNTCESDVAGAVHTAVRQMRRRWGGNTPLAWASHIHVGA